MWCWDDSLAFSAPRPALQSSHSLMLAWMVALQPAMLWASPLNCSVWAAMVVEAAESSAVIDATSCKAEGEPIMVACKFKGRIEFA